MVDDVSPGWMGGMLACNNTRQFLPIDTSIDICVQPIFHTMLGKQT